MAKLYLKYEQVVVQEYELKEGYSATIGRLPDNDIHIENLAASGHHARIVWESDHFAVEDTNSLNGTFVNNRRITRSALKDGDVILVGRHSLGFFEAAQATSDGSTLVGTKITEATAASNTRGAHASGASGAAVAPAKIVTGQVVVISGKTDRPEYVLNGKVSVIGKSEMASIKLTGWFAPKVAAMITHRDGKYYVGGFERHDKVKVNEERITGQKELTDGDLIEVAGVKLTFSHISE